MIGLYDSPKTARGAATYQGKECFLGHGRTRYRSNGVCIECAKARARDARIDTKNTRKLPVVVARREQQFRDNMASGLRALREAAVHLRGARDMAARSGEWRRALRSAGVQAKAVSAIRRWLEETEKRERMAASGERPATDGNATWMEG